MWTCYAGSGLRSGTPRWGYPSHRYRGGPLLTKPRTATPLRRPLPASHVQMIVTTKELFPWPTTKIDCSGQRSQTIVPAALSAQNVICPENAMSFRANCLCLVRESRSLPALFRAGDNDLHPKFLDTRSGRGIYLVIGYESVYQ